MPKKRRREHIKEELRQSVPNSILDENVEDAIQIKMEPVDNGYEYEPTELIPTKTVIYNETDENRAAVEAEVGLISQLDIIKTEVDVDDVTMKEFREEVRRISCANDESNKKQRAKKRKREFQQKKTPSKDMKKTKKEKRMKNNKKQDRSTTEKRSKQVEVQPLDIKVDGVKMAKCHFCDFQLTSRNRSLVKEHMRLHTGFSPYACIHCPQKFINRSSLVHHVQRDHPTKKRYKCPLCRGWFFTKKQFDSHELKCVKRRSFQCHLCKLKMDRLYMYKVNEHMRKEHTGEALFQCEHCDETFLTKGRLRCHEKRHPGVVPYKCSNCVTRFKTEDQLKIHETHCLTRQRFECHICKYSYTKLSFKGLGMHMRKHTGVKPFQCQYCQKFYPRVEALAHHIQRHRDLFKFKCAQCHRRCFNADELKKHEEKCRKRRYECHLCGFTKFGLSQNKFRRHFELKHVGEKYSKCMGCTKSFSSTSLLARHITEHHPKLLALICPNCNRRFASRAARDLHQSNCMKRRTECYICKQTSRDIKMLRSHMVRSHTGEAKFQCHLCPRKYLVEVNLKIHINSHTKIGLMKCDYCSKEFSHIKYKKKHEFRCKQVFECCLCKKVLPSFAILKGVHMREHLGTRPYSCKHCTKTFVSIRTYVLHVLGVHLHQYKFQCNTCNGIIKKKQDVNKHQRSCMKPIRQSAGIIYFKCSLCGDGLPRVPELRAHILNGECTKHPKRVRIN